MGFKLLGVGSPLVDYSLPVTDELLNEIVPDGKGCTRNLSHQERSFILNKVPVIFRSPGGSAGNTVRAFAHLGGQAALFGKLAGDEDGEFFREELKKSGADDSLLLNSTLRGTGCCFNLITPDAERTMLSDLAASREISESELDTIPFKEFSLLLMEGYLAMEKWSIPLLEKARKNGLLIALDLNNYELIRRERSRFRHLVDKFVDILFANEEEIEALIPGGYPLEVNKHLPNALITIIKQGERGALWVISSKHTPYPAIRVDEVKDTTGAGDFYAAGVIYGLSRELSAENCNRAAALCAAEVIRQNGTMLTDEQWRKLKTELDKINSGSCNS